MPDDNETPQDTAKRSQYWPETAPGSRRHHRRSGRRRPYSRPAQRRGHLRPLLTSKHEFLRYDQALAAGWPIATGVIGACRHLIGDRLDITGARWGLEAAEAILTLRAVITNGDFEEYWRFHLARELSTYRQPCLPESLPVKRFAPAFDYRLSCQHFHSIRLAHSPDRPVMRGSEQLRLHSPERKHSALAVIGYS
jgi:hypothetical protein